MLRCLRRALWHGYKAKKLRVPGGNGDLRDTVIPVSCNDPYRSALGNRSHKSGMVCGAVMIPVQEYKIATGRGSASRFGVQPTIGHIREPFLTVAPIGESIDGDIRVVQAEGGEHGAPVFVGTSKPGSVAGIAMGGAILPDRVIPGAFRIAQLAFGNGDHILPPVAGECHIRKGLLPDFRCLYVRTGV